MKSPLYLWLQAVLGQAIEGASDAFLTVTGGSTAAQLSSVPVPAVTPKQLLLSMAVLSGIYVASYLKKNPTPWSLPASSASAASLHADAETSA